MSGRIAAQVREQEERDARSRAREIVTLAARYEAIRGESGPARTAAYNALAQALARIAPDRVLCGERWWRWSKALGELTSEPAGVRAWRDPEDSHGAARSYRDGYTGPRPDLEEIVH